MKHQKISKNSFDEFEKSDKRRIQLLPWWIKVFCWIFMLFGFLAALSLIGIFIGINASLAIYGFETNEPFSVIGIFIIAIGIFKGFTAYTLWFEKDIAIKVGKIDAIIGIIVCIISMCVIPYLQENVGFTFRLELVLLIPYLIKLTKIEKEWKAIQ
ncbi:hypothetical protein [Kordia jejudonensis]|uniref:hypothetical protein n=1 Tax=Kordia jejudonensis TaxID=1348245 RepID=UPI0006298B56|nr:hypothetical protein [Kordia jejudonensis]